MNGLRTLAATCAVVMAAGMVAGCDDGEGGAGAPVVTGNPATTFAPLVVLHADEEWNPIGAETFIDHSKLSWSNDGCPDQTVATGVGRAPFDPGRRPRLRSARLGGDDPYRARSRTRDDVCQHPAGRSYSTTDRTRPHGMSGREPGLEAGNGFYLDLLTDWTSGERAGVRRGDSPPRAGSVPVYVDARSAGDGQLRLTYWLLFGYDRPPWASVGGGHRHEGDWERISVLVRRDGRRTYVPLSVQYHRSGLADGDETLPWADVEVAGPTRATGEATHPIAYAANGSHTLYPRPGRYALDERSSNGRRIAVAYDTALACARCPRWRTWGNVLDARRQGWYGFGGAWGSVWQDRRTTGPTGPARWALAGSPAPIPRPDRSEIGSLFENRGSESDRAQLARLTRDLHRRAFGGGAPKILWVRVYGEIGGVTVERSDGDRYRVGFITRRGRWVTDLGAEAYRDAVGAGDPPGGA